MMLHIPQVLTPQQVSHIRSELQRADWVDGRETVGEQGARVKRNRQLPELSPLGFQLGEIILDALRRNPIFFAAALPKKTMPPLFNSYEGGEHYGLHVDGSVRMLPNAAGSIRTDVSTTVFLSDPDEYDGGELVVVDTYGTHEVKLPAGDMIVYPSTSLHRVEPVTRGARVCSFFWTQSMIRDDWKRSMLFELDRNIFGLRQKLGDTEEVLGLTGHYHNLLRQWADV
ncbi:Fe2+-dependent dioxygenase [Herbaspirillum huttiense]|jgi:PKHD-type hydroxylase|uniref:Fe2+-dependent dioxygenase n=2 Tax=Herbaspirillum huttiense TaxID=863372 RepID=A0AAJ2LTN5_9BURK|nr:MULTISPECIES: Fe2+-dependent dioxygenase [Herbaspirillum]MDR9835066.1 Fe2+-dependent dioxygenase [Herbaspirillum huttiense]